MPDVKETTAIKSLLGDFAPKIVELADNVLFGDIWKRIELSARDRSLITIACLIANKDIEQLPFHINKGIENGLTQKEIVEIITHLAFYAGWPKAMSAISIAKEIFKAKEEKL